MGLFRIVNKREACASNENIGSEQNNLFLYLMS